MNRSTRATMFDKIWDAHAIATLPGGMSLLHVDRHLIHDLEAGPDLARLEAAGVEVRRPDLTFATPDHAISTAPGRNAGATPSGAALLRDMRRRCSSVGIHVFDLGESGQGIVHVIGPELGITLPGMLIVCADSHTCTHGGIGGRSPGASAPARPPTCSRRRPSVSSAQRRCGSGWRARPRRRTAKDLVLFRDRRLGCRRSDGVTPSNGPGAPVRGTPSRVA